jgi:hypothetical protein
MLAVEAYVVERGMKVRVRSTCTGQCHMGTFCQGRSVDHLVPTQEIEDYGFSGALQFAVRRILEVYPGLL